MMYTDPILILIPLFLFFTLSYYTAYGIIPVIIKTVTHNHFLVEPGIRSSHKKSTPTLGGISFFISITVSLFFIKKYDISHITLQLIIALTVLLLLGIKDDLMALSSKTKIQFQSLSIFLVLLNPQMRITNFYGFLNVHELPLWFSIVFSYFLLLYIINAYNLIDGIDGLAGMQGIFVSSVLVVVFYYTSLYYYMFIGIIITGFLLAFLKYNLSKHRKIFMGDTGSMIVGFLLGFLILRFLSLEPFQLEHIYILPENIVIISLSLLFLPVIDVIRVVIIRLMNNQFPFIADRRHLHHVFIDKGLNHKKASFTITIISFFIFLTIFTLNLKLSYIFLTIIFLLFLLMTFYLLLMLGKDSFSRDQRKKIRSYFPHKIYLIEYRFRKFMIILLKKMFFRELL